MDITTDYLGFSSCVDITTDYQQLHNIPLHIARSPGTPWVVAGPKRPQRRRRKRMQKRGCRGGLLAWLRKNPYKPPLPSIFLTNARSFVHKTDKLELLMANNRNICDCSVMIITKTWLHSFVLDSAFQLTGCSMHHFNRNKSSCKSRGEGLCIHVHMDWCTSSRVIHPHCSPDLVVMTECNHASPWYWQVQFSL